MFLNHPPVQGRIHDGFYDGELVGSCCSKASPNHDTSTSCFTGGMRFFSWNAILGLHQRCPLFWCLINSVLYSSVQRTLFQRSWSLSAFFLANFSLAFMFFLESKHFFHANLPWKLNMCHISLIVEACTFILLESLSIVKIDIKYPYVQIWTNMK